MQMVRHDYPRQRLAGLFLISLRSSLMTSRACEINEQWFALVGDGGQQ
jgi:hypothetical protein